jgi:hypothetical protein
MLVVWGLCVALWVPMLSHVMGASWKDYQQPGKLGPETQKLVTYQTDAWTRKSQKKKLLSRMRKSNAEWDFMGRSFVAWSLANLALREPSKRASYLQVIDKIIDETVTLERQKGMHFFLMPYSRRGPFVMQPARSLFLDGEIALMMGMRRMVKEHPEYKRQMRERIGIIVSRMQKSPTLSVESYPDEAWIFCNTVALAAIKVSDALDGTDHNALFAKWVQVAKQKLIHKPSGLLISAYTLKGKVKQGPEGSSIWMAVHNLSLVAPVFARKQYRLARKHLGRTILGFSYSREWPDSWKAGADIDSGMVIPVLGASAGASGLALVGAATFQDRGFLQGLLSSLHLAAFPERTNTTLRFRASNQVGDAVMLYALVQGPMWKAVRKRTKQSTPTHKERKS